MIVVDASALLEVLLRTQRAEAVEALFFTPNQTIHAPHLIDVEATQVIRRFTFSGAITGQRAQAAIEDLAAFPIRRHPHTALLPRMWELRHNLTAYDAAYVALAEALDAGLATLDRRIATAAGHYAKILPV